MTTRRVLSLSLVLVVGLAAVARAADRPTVSEALRRAELAFAAQHYTEAATHMEAAFALDADPQWLANAGYAWMMAGDQQRALTSLSTALADTRLKGPVRDKANERLARAQAVQGQLAEVDAAEQAGELARAAEGMDAAYALVASGHYLIRAAGLWEKAGELDKADGRYRTAATLSDLSAAERALGIDGLTRVAAAKLARDKPEEVHEQPKPEPIEASPPILGWSLIGGGAAAIGLGITGFVVAVGKRSDGEARRDTLTQDEADAINDSAEGWWNIGLVATGVGVVALATGIVLVVSDDGGRTTQGSVEVGAVPLRGGGAVVAFGRF